MLDCIDRQQRNKLKLDNLSLPSPERHRPLRHQFSSDNMHVPPFNIPNLRIDQRKTSSAEDMARKNSTGSIRKSIEKVKSSVFMLVDGDYLFINFL
jgi:SCY1-like protein 2